MFDNTDDSQATKDNNVVEPTDNATVMQPQTTSQDTMSSDDPMATTMSPSLPIEDPTLPAESASEQPLSPHVDVPEMPDNDLLDLKRKALHELSPIISQLDQTPEEKFKTVMMLIQASDDQSLLTAAYESAQSITDEKVKAKALLDLVNEIDYFAQPKTS